jgi:glycerol-3-phosphate dehydrogenase
MRRSPSELSSQTYDLAVVGGGITGACIARDAARRGLKVCILERRDWSSGTSSASSKLVHGGLRYLKQLQFGLIRESLAERRIWERIAPHLVRPLPFLVPFFGEGTGAKLTLRAGLTLYDLLSYDKGWLDDPDQRLPGHRMLSRAEAVALEPLLDQPGFSGAIQYADCQMDSPERLGLECVIDAVENGAAAANYVAVTGFLNRTGTVEGVSARDTLSGETFEVQARVTINAAGPWADLLLAHAGERGGASVHLLRSKGIHVIVPAVTRRHALTVQHKGKHFFVLPWRGHTILGTTDTEYRGDPDAVRAEPEDVAALLSAVNGGLAFLNLTERDVLHAYAGLRPLVDDGSGSSYHASRKSEIVDHAPSGAPGLLSAIGGKWTTSRRVAAKAVDLAQQHLAQKHLGQKHLGQKRGDGRTGETPLPGGAIGRVKAFHAAATAATPELTSGVRETALRLYGARYGAMLAQANGDPSLLAPLSNSATDTGAAVLHAVRAEMAVTLSDAVFRRTGLGGLGHPGRPALERAAHIMGGELGWSAERRQSELDAVERQFPVARS